MEITGYKYNTESDAIAARKQCADFYGLPSSPDNIVKYWVNYQEANLDTPVFYYITFIESIREILGEPETFNVVEDTTP
tara:strand:+ start:370 stop:606 length:237 start_codon:yes stop_codon:yes gene_type:complete